MGIRGLTAALGQVVFNKNQNVQTSKNHFLLTYSCGYPLFVLVFAQILICPQKSRLLRKFNQKPLLLRQQCGTG